MEEEKKPVVDIMNALKESIEKAKTNKKPMQKAKGRTASEQATKTKKRKTA